jgi:predicted RNase H-like HicB family nuclease
MRHTVLANIRRGEESGYVAECPELHVVTQGRSLDDVAANLREAVSLALEDEDLLAMGLVDPPVLLVTFELEPLVA